MGNFAAKSPSVFVEEVKENRRVQGRFLLKGSLVLADAVSVIFAFYLSHFINSFFFNPNELLAIVLLILFSFKIHGLYEEKIRANTLDEFPRVLSGVTLATFLLILYSPALKANLKEILKSQNYLPYFWLLAILAVPMFRVFIRFIFGKVRARGLLTENLLIVGTGEVSSLIAKKVERHPELGLKVRGFLDSKLNGEHANFLGRLSQFRKIVQGYDINHVIISFSTLPDTTFLKMVREGDDLDLKIHVVPRLFEVVWPESNFFNLEGIPLITLRKAKMSRFNQVIKRAVDLVGATLITLLLSPIFTIAALLIKIDSRGPVFFRQERVGKFGKRFYIFKFRSMVADAEAKQEKLLHLNEASGPLFKIKEDPRVTRVGRWLRKLSIDELPQIFNVLKGNMSLVGPRPPLPSEVKRYEEWEKKRLNITPGITGLWQVTGRSDLPFKEMVKLDYLYIQNWSLWLDFKLLLQTIPVVLFQKGAY